jgi:16S rRNA C967 or C1407 C5-methylase (RsmB/RsmF family)
MQKDILMSADILLRPGGLLVYSTCSFSLAEDEEMINGLLIIIQNMNYSQSTMKFEFRSCVNGVEALTRTVRIWPHESAGDGISVRCCAN